MRRSRIYLDQPLTSGSTLQLDEFGSGHLCRVLRLREGDPLILFNGGGAEFEAVLTLADHRSAKVLLGAQCEARAAESSLELELGLGISRSDRFDWALQKSVELGVARIRPLLCARSDRYPKDRLAKKMGQWQRLIISSCEQSGRLRVPLLLEPLAIEDWAAADAASLRLHLHPDGSSLAELAPVRQSNQAVVLAVGPEGGFDEAEVACLGRNNFLAVRLGPRIMRTETAPLAALAICQFVWGDLG